MWRAWVAGGLQPDTFWQYTPGEVGWCMAGVADRRRAEHRDRAWLAYQTAALSVSDPKQWPSFEEIADIAPPSKASQIERERVTVANEDFMRTVRRLRADAKRDR